jgi:CHAT domain-containing protein/uncharacterized protein HemY
MSHTVKTFVWILICILFTSSLYAQDDELEKAKEAYQIAGQLKKEKKYLESVPYLQKVLTYFKKLEDKSNTSQLLAEIVECYWNVSDYANAQKFSEQRLTLCQEIKDINAQKFLLADLGQLALIHEKNNEKATKYLNESLQLCQMPDDSDLMLYDYDKLAKITSAEKQYSAHRKYLEKIRELYLKSNQKLKEGYTYWQEGLSYDAEKNYQESVKSYEKALDYYQTPLSDTTNTAILLSNIGKTYKNLKEYDKAISYFQKSFELRKQQNNKAEMGESYWDIASTYNYKKDLNSAVNAYQKARQFYNEGNYPSEAASMVTKIARLYQEDKQYDKANTYYQETLRLRTAIGKKDGIGEAWWDIAYNYDLQKNFDKANEGYKTAINFYLQAGNKEDAATLYENLAINAQSEKNYKESVSYHQKTLALRQETGKKELVAKSTQNIGSVYWEAKDFAQAKSYYEKALQLYREVRDKSGEIYSLVNLAKLYNFYEIDLKKSEAMFNEALALAEKEKNESILAFCYSELANLYEQKGDYKKYKELKDKSLALYEKIDDQVNVGYQLISTGTFYTGRGDFEKGIEFYEKAIKLGEKIENDKLIANAYTRIAWIDAYRSSFAEATTKLQKALGLYLKTADDLGMADVYFSMGQNLISEGKYQEAEKYLAKTDSIYVLNRMDAARGDLNNARGRLYYRQQDFQKSYQYHKADYDTRIKYGDNGENYRVAAVNVGECLMLLKKYPEANTYLQASLDHSHKNQDRRGEAVTLEVLGELRINEKKYAEAEKYLNDALRIHKEMKTLEREAGVLRLLARLYYETKRYPDAIRVAEEGVGISQRIGLDFYMWESLNVLGDVYKLQNQKPKSITYYKEAVEALERMRGSVTGGEEAQKLFSSGEDKIKVYETLIDLLLQQGEVEEAMEYLQRNNQGQLQNRFKNIKIDYQNDQKDKLHEEERSQKMKIESLDKQLSAEKSKPEAEQNLEKIQNLQKVRNVAANEYVNFARKNLSNSDADRFVDLRLQKTKIPKDMAVLSYLSGDKALYIFVATKDSAIARVVPLTNEELKKRITYVRNRLRTHDTMIKNELSSKNETQNRSQFVKDVKQTDEFLKTIEQLYQSLIAPVQDVVQSKTKLAIMPSGELHFLPFQILGKTLPDGNFNFLIEDFNIFYAKDFKMLNRTDKIEANSMKIVAFANPDKTLPATEKEVNDIKKTYPNTQAFYRDDATEDKAKTVDANYNVIHFATHGNLDYSRPEKSFLTMAKNLTKGEDGMLSLQDLWGLELMSNLNLVVLSACNTAMSSNAEVPISPATGFFDNGVKSVIASLWKVNDDATALLMADFYNNLKTMEVSEALRQAQINLTKNPKFHHPYYWSPFILMGDWK